MRFDDCLDTVLSADDGGPLALQATWRQLVDLIARGRAPAEDRTIARLISIRTRVPLEVRQASARAAAFARPPAALVRLFADEDTSVAAPVLRTAQLGAEEWHDILPQLSPVSRSILRHRRDLPTDIVRALESFGNVDFLLDEAVTENEPALALPKPASPPFSILASPTEAVPIVTPESPFVSLSTVALGLPLVAEALRREDSDEPTAPSSLPGTSPPQIFPIADLVARIDAYQHRRATDGLDLAKSKSIAPLFGSDAQSGSSFRFETDAHGLVRWVEGVARAPLIGLPLDLSAGAGDARIDTIAEGAFRHWASLTNARLVVEGSSDAGGTWRVSGVPAFDPASGRFAGYRGTARRPRPDKQADELPQAASFDGLRQLVHELRTPTNAIAGFAEMIETETLGSVPPAYRGYAETIRREAGDLLTAIEDLDIAARIDAGALDLRTGQVRLTEVLLRIREELAPLAVLRGATLEIASPDGEAISGDDRAIERLLARLLATLLGVTERGEAIAVKVLRVEGLVLIAIDRPRAFTGLSDGALLNLDAERDETSFTSLLGAGFALRLVQNLALELKGGLVITEDRLTLQLPATVIADMGPASFN